MTAAAQPHDSRPQTAEALQAHNAELAHRLEEAEETIRAIRHGAVDAFVIEDLPSYRVFTLEGADRHYRLFVENMPQSVATVDEDGTVVYCNHRLTELFKEPHTRVIGAPLRDLVAAHDRAAYAELLSRGKEKPTRGEVQLRRADGGLVPVALAFEPLPRDSGPLIGVFITDLTVQKQHEQLVSAQAALQEADRRKNEFLAMLAHELRNPLAPISNAIDILRTASNDSSAVQSISAMLERQVGQMVRLVNDLLDVSRISRGRPELHKIRVELSSVVEQALDSIRPIATSMSHELLVSLPSTPVYLDGDAVRLIQVFANLLDNACKYTKKGGRVQVTAEVPRSEPDRPGEVVVRIRDTGIGILPDQLSRIFEMFAQVDTSLERPRGGLGIGLTLVKSLVEAHGGRVEAHSDGPGQGSEFVVRLPVVAGQESPARRERSPESATPTYRILVVDDNRDSAESLAMLLRLTGHETHTVFDGLAAVEAAGSLRPDIVLLDVGMPVLNGYHACRQIRAQSWGREMVLIAQTGWGQDDDRRRTAEAGFDGHVVKPVDTTALMKLVASLPRGRQPEAPKP
jgi:PAS domain S-box-containing protein